MERIVELSDIIVYREEMDKYKVSIEHDSDKNTDIIYSYLLERLQINGGEDTKNISDEEYSVTIKTYSIKPFEKYLEEHNYRLDYDIVLKILQEYSNIILYLERKEKSIVLYGLEDLIVIDDSTFLFINNENIFDLQEHQPTIIDISVPLEMTKFASPELQQQKSLPFSLDYRSGFFSLASVLTYCLFAETLLEKDEAEVNKLLEPIYHTKLYWFIKRCAERNSKRRVCLFV